MSRALDDIEQVEWIKGYNKKKEIMEIKIKFYKDQHRKGNLGFIDMLKTIHRARRDFRKGL